MIQAYCNNESCEYNEDCCCEYEDTLSIDEHGNCESFKFRVEE